MNCRFHSKRIATPHGEKRFSAHAQEASTIPEHSKRKMGPVDNGSNGTLSGEDREGIAQACKNSDLNSYREYNKLPT